MFPNVVLPLLAALVLAGTVTATHRRLPPELAARTVLVTLVVVVGAAIPTVLIVAASYLTHLRFLGGRFEWCRHVFGAHQATPSWIGIPAAGLTGWGAWRVVSVLRSYRRLRHVHGGNVHIADDGGVFAYTLPGRGGLVVVSAGLLDLLNEEERDVVIAHERAHAHLRHDRYLLVGHLAAGAVAFLKPLTSRLQFCLERWADESAVVASRGDRALVARTLGKVALNSPVPPLAPALGGVGVPARVAALLRPVPVRPCRAVVISMWIVIGTVAVLGWYQLHHLGMLLAALCPG